MADPHPKVLNLTFSIIPDLSFTCICSFITSPHAGAPTIPVPTLAKDLSMDPTFLGFV